MWQLKKNKKIEFFLPNLRLAIRSQSGQGVRQLKTITYKRADILYI